MCSTIPHSSFLRPLHRISSLGKQLFGYYGSSNQLQFDLLSDQIKFYEAHLFGRTVVVHMLGCFSPMKASACLQLFLTSHSSKCSFMCATNILIGSSGLISGYPTPRPAKSSAISLNLIPLCRGIHSNSTVCSLAKSFSGFWHSVVMFCEAVSFPIAS